MAEEDEAGLLFLIITVRLASFSISFRPNGLVISMVSMVYSLNIIQRLNVLVELLLIGNSEYIPPTRSADLAVPSLNAIGPRRTRCHRCMNGARIWRLNAPTAMC